MESRERWTCPDLPGMARPEGRHQLVLGSQIQFPECPAAYLRTPALIATLRTRRGGRVFSEHLINGVTHPDELVAPAAMEFKAGARTLDSMSVKMQELVKLRLSEDNAREVYEDELREQERRSGANRQQ